MNKSTDFIDFSFGMLGIVFVPIKLTILVVTLFIVDKYTQIQQVVFVIVVGGLVWVFKYYNDEYRLTRIESKLKECRKK
jgi:hypothetical protein